jgi:2-iminobutanoate/2-iminopropanoate deaminase
MVMTLIIPVTTGDAPAPAGHYSQAMVANGQVYISGQLPIRPDGARLPDDSFEMQADQAIGNVLAILKAAGGHAGNLVRVTAYIVGVENWPRFNAVYAKLLPDARPARTVVPVTQLHHGYLVEVDAIAIVPSRAIG